MTEFDRFIDLIPPNDLNEIENTYFFVQKLETIKKIEHIPEINKWLSENIVHIPWDNTLKCLSIISESFEEIPSKTRPIKIGILVETKYNQEMIMHVLLKQEDVHKDYISMLICCLAEGTLGPIPWAQWASGPRPLGPMGPTRGRAI